VIQPAAAGERVAFDGYDLRGAEMGCLFALMAGLFPRLAFFIYWIARPAKVDAAFDTFLIPLLGIIFLPFATLIYALLYTPGIGLTGWEWFWVAVAGLFDILHWVAGASQRSQFRRSAV
jgi:hypothetical protein